MQSIGLTSRAVLEIASTRSPLWPDTPEAVPVETHDLRNTCWGGQLDPPDGCPPSWYDADAACPDHDWDVWEITLLAVGVPEAVTPGETTRLGCGYDTGHDGVGASLAFRMTQDVDTGSLIPFNECAIWGLQSHQFFNEYLPADAGYGQVARCVCFDLDGDCTN